MYSALDIAKYVINKCTVDGIPISNLQLQKILYYIQKEFLEIYRAVAFSEKIEAWQFGPVVPNIYRLYCGFGAMPITMRYNVNLSSEHRTLIDALVEKKRVLNPWDMVADTHKQGKAWAEIYNNGWGDHQEIPVNLILKKG